jgi:beta-N-acetylhexosaminidase
VVDLCSNPDNPVIARLERCFSAQPAQVTRHAQQFIQAHQDQGVISVIKHFPGHGSSQKDSHLGFVDVSTSWKPAELTPYIALIAAGKAEAIMTAHVFNATLDADHPATLSRFTITGLLRKQLGFKGVVFSDDLQMKAVTEHYGLDEAVRLAIEAGVDILLFGNNLEYDSEIVPRVVGIIRDLVAVGKISEERIDESYRRILRLKGVE